MTASLKSIDKQSIYGLGQLQAVDSPAPKTSLHLVVHGQLQINTSTSRGSFAKVHSKALTAAGLGSNVLIAQFLKGGEAQGPRGGIKLCDRLHWLRPSFPFCITETKSFYDLSTQEYIQKAIEEIWTICKQKLASGFLDRLVLDEIGVAIASGYLQENELISTLESRPPSADVILTGPSIPSRVIEMADEVTVLR